MLRSDALHEVRVVSDVMTYRQRNRRVIEVERFALQEFLNRFSHTRHDGFEACGHDSEALNRLRAFFCRQFKLALFDEFPRCGRIKKCIHVVCKAHDFTHGFGVFALVKMVRYQSQKIP